MDFRCPNCQKDLNVQDEYAGLQMKCPLCQHIFQAPSLPPPSGTTLAAAFSPPAPPSTSPGQRPPPPASTSAPTPPPPASSSAKTPSPPADYTRTRSLRLSPAVAPWIAPACLAMLFVLLFATWVRAVPEPGVVVPRGAWSLGFSEGNVLTILYILLLVPTALVSLAIAVARFLPNLKLPPALQTLWPWRSALVAMLATLALLFLFMQALAGFHVSADGKPLPPYSAFGTGWLTLTLLLTLAALVGSLLEFWLEQRGPDRPAPRLDILW